jgi:hypothetical protein
MKKPFLLFSLFLGCFLVGPAYATTIDLDAAFDDEADGIIHFGDNSSGGGIVTFVDQSTDFDNQSTVVRTFNVTEAPIPGGSFQITIDHYEVNIDLASGFADYFSINGYQFGPLSDSYYGGVPVLDSAGIHTQWVNETFSGQTSLLNLTVGSSNTIIFDIGAVGTNLDDFEITNFELTYTPVPEPSTMLLLTSGLIGIVGASRRKLKKK